MVRIFFFGRAVAVLSLMAATLGGCKATTQQASESGQCTLVEPSASETTDSNAPLADPRPSASERAVPGESSPPDSEPGAATGERVASRALARLWRTHLPLRS